jgi:hypothetical protein
MTLAGKMQKIHLLPGETYEEIFSNLFIIIAKVPE